MKKIKLFIAMSLDGYIADASGGIQWLDPYNSVADDSYQLFYETIDTVIMGSKTYQQITEVLSPESYPYRDAETYVFSTRHLEPQERVTIVNQPVDSFVSSLKEMPGKDIWIVGGAAIVEPLVKANLIDEYWIAVAPVLLGDGIPLFSKMDFVQTLVPMSAEHIGQLVYLKYQKRK